MNSIKAVLKIATHSHHMRHPFCNEELSVKKGRYANWQMKGILIFAIATIFSLGMATCFFIGTAYLKHKQMIQKKDERPFEQNVQRVVRDVGLNANAVQPQNLNAQDIQPIDVRQKFRKVENSIIKEIETISPFNHSALTIGLIVMKVSNQDEQEVTKHGYLHFAQNDPDLEASVRTQIQEVQNDAANEIEAHINEKLEIEWKVLMKGHNEAAAEDIFSEAHGRWVKTPTSKVNSSGKGETALQRAKRDFEDILTRMECPQAWLQPLALPDGEENDPLAGIVF